MAGQLDLPLSHVFPRNDARKLVPEIVRGIMESIRDVGIINPIRVRPTKRHVEGVLADAYEVTAGHHRLSAALKAGLETVPCILVADDDLHAELAMIDENLCRAELDPAQRAKQTARRKAIYVELHPETKHGGEREPSRQVGDLPNVVRFTAETAAATGKSERAVQRDAERGEKIASDVLDRIATTKLNRGDYLDKLKKLTPEHQREKIDRDLRVPAKAVAPPAAPRNEFEIINKEHAVLISAWERARPEARERFLRDIGAAIEAPIMDQKFA